MRFFHKQISLWLLISMLFGSLTVPANAGAKSRATVCSTQSAEGDEEEEGLRFRLSQAPDQPEGEAQAASPLAPTTVLSDLETANILKRLAPIKVEGNDEQEFALRERSLPAPRTGQTISVSFPPAANVAPAETVASGPLEVVRYSPEGAVPLAPNLSVTFSQPMIAVSSQEEAAAYVPVKLSPQPPGKWRWIGTRTLLFEPSGRFPMATNYSVAVPAGTKSATGSALGGAKTWTFATPAPKVKQTYPPANATQARDALMFIEFDQRIDPAAVLKTIKVVGGKTELRTRLASKAEIEANENVHNLTKDAEKDRWIAFRAVDANGDSRLALPVNESINILVGPGTPSAEGPVATKEQQSFAFRTFGPLRLLNAQCQSGNNNQRDCAPDDIWRFEFSNNLDADSFQESQVRIDPVTPALKLVRSGGVIHVFGVKKPNTIYRLTIDKSLRDHFGQTLGEDKTVEFKITSAPPNLFLSGQGFAVLDPAAPRQLSLYSLNFKTVKVSLYAVEPEDWSKYQEYRQQYSRNTNEVKGILLPGRAVFSKQLVLKSNPNEMVETAIDLTPALKDGLGQVIVSVESIPPVSDIYHSPLMAWVQSTKIGLDAFVDNDELIGWATSLEDGAPLRDVQMKVSPTGLSGATGPDGLAHLPLHPALGSPASVLIARRGNDVAILPEGAQYWFNGNGSWHRKPQTDELRWYAFDDRRLYRPGEEVHLKGWIRVVGGGRGGDVGPLNGAVRRVRYKVNDESENEISKGELTLNLFGGFNTVFKLPPTMNLGIGTVEFEAIDGDAKLGGRNSQHQFQVQEFRRPEFEVTAKTESEGPLFVGGHADISVTANYFSGGGLQNAEVKWSVTSTPTNFTPPNRDDYTFGKWTPWWLGAGGEDNNDEKLTGRTDAAGKHRLRIDFESVKPARPSTLIAEASVTDVNRQTWTSTARLLVHPANLYVGLKSDRIFVQQGEPLVVQSIVTDLDGKAIADRDINIHAVLLDWKQVKNEWKQVEVNPQDCSVRSGVDAVKCTFGSKDGGSYRITATVRDDRERLNQTEFTLWVAGGKRQAQRDLEEEKVELIPDRKDYKAGDTAQILVQAPFYPAEAVMSVRRSGIVKTQRFRMDGPTYTVKVPIEETWTPNVRVQVDLVGATERSSDIEEESKVLKALPKRPAFASGELNLSIPPGSRELKVSAAPQNGTLEPGGTTTVDIDVKNAEGRPVSDSEVALVVVDESVLALTQYKIADPMKIFYEERSAGVNDYHLRQNVLLANTLDLLSARQLSQLPVNGRLNFALAKMAPGLMAMAASETVNVTAARSVSNFDAIDGVNDKGSQKTELQLRKDFNALAVFAPSVRTDASGRAHVQVKLPDNLTRYRVMAVAVAGGKQFGTGESAITARLPLMARPSAPRFLNFGDRFEFPITVQNQTDAAIVVDLAVRATNALLSGPGAVATGSQDMQSTAQPKPVQTGRRVTVPANDRVEVRIPAAAVKAGTARFQVAAVSGKWSDAAEVELPVWTPATTEAFATYGEIDEGAITQRVKAPANVFKQFGGLEIETSSTQLQQLTDAFLYLQSYPYECSEQLSSRIISVAALRDVLTAFKAKDLPSPEAMEAAVVRDLKRLQGMQNDDGGFGFWKRGDESWPYLGIHVAHALARAKQKKFDVPKEMFDRSQKYLREIEQHIPPSYSVEARRAISAYALYVRAQMGDRDPLRARRLIEDAGLENLSLESVGWLLAVLSNDKDSLNQVTALRRLLSNRVAETAATAHFVCSYKDSDYLLLNSDRRADGIILEALIGDQPSSDLIPKIVRGLLDHRTRGRWENTQENVFILLALDRYFNAYEKVSPNFVARVWLGNAFAGEQQFKGRSTDRQQLNVPMSYLVDKGSGQGSGQNLILSKEGPGRLYYRLGMNYAPVDLDLKAADYGFVVTRSYEAVDHPEDVRKEADGTWHVKAGARVRVRLTMVAPARRYHVALVDPLPAGFETLNPVLSTSESIPEDKKQTGVAEFGSRSVGNMGWWYWRSVWFDHQNLRDERAEAFTSLLWEGVYNYSYIARATTPGAFVVPPAKAEEMYHPETFGRGKSDRVRVE